MAKSGVNINMGVTGISQFKADIRSAKESIKTLDTQLALTEKQFKATGDQEDYMRQKTEQLKSKLEAQKSVAASAEKALDQMTKQGVDKSTKAFQEMIRTLANAKGDMLETQTQLNAIGANADKAGGEAKEMNTQLGNIGKNVGWGNVTEGIGKITDTLEKGAKAAVNFGKKIARSAMDSTGWADDVLTEATKYGTDAETIQRMRNVAEFIDTDVDTILNAKSRLAKNKGSLGEALGIEVDGKTVDEAFWAAGEAIMNMTDEFQQEEAAQKVFGRGWKELVPLFTAGQEEYNQLMEEQNVLTNEQVQNLGKADDAIKSVQQQIELMKNQFWAENADKIIEMGKWIVKNKDPLVAALGAIAVGFGALKLGEVATNILKVVEGFKALGGGAAGSLGSAGAAGAAGLGTLAVGTIAVGSIIAASIWAADKRNNHPETVRGTDENLAAQSAGAEAALAEFIMANRAMADADFVNIAAEEAEALAARVEAARAALDQTEGGADALAAYNDWRQEHSYGNTRWELPENLAAAVQELTGGAEAQTQSNSEMAQAAQGLYGLPADIANAISGAMSGIGISIDGQALIGYINTAMGDMVNNP